MAELSNHLMAFTVLAYLAAMVAYAGEYAFGDRSRIGRAAARPARQLVGAGVPVAAHVTPDAAIAGDVAPGGAARGPAGRAGRRGRQAGGRRRVGRPDRPRPQ